MDANQVPPRRPSRSAGAAFPRLTWSSHVFRTVRPPPRQAPPDPVVAGLRRGRARSRSRRSASSDRAKSKQEVDAWTDAQAIPAVRLVQPEPGPPEQSLLLPGNVSAFNISPLFARASGYVTAWHSDIGAHVKKGDVLVTISAPDLDQQLEEAKAQLVQLQAAVEQAQANADLGQVTNGRTARLVAQGWSSLGTGRHRSLDGGVADRRVGGRQSQCDGPAGGGQPAPGADRLRRDQGAVRRRRHGTQRQYRRSPQCRRDVGEGPLPGRRPPSDAHFCACAASVPWRSQAWRQGDVASARPAADVRGGAVVNLKCAGGKFPHRADRVAGRQSGRQAVARRLHRSPVPYSRRPRHVARFHPRR